MLNISKVSENVNVCCPNCTQVLKTVTSNEIICYKPPHYFDGDTIFSVFDMLTPEQREATSHDYGVLVGRCPTCKIGLYTMIVCFLNSKEPTAIDYVRFNLPVGTVTNYNCTLDGSSSWVMNVYETPLGDLFHSQLGVYILDDDSDIVTKYGVSACTGDNKVWDFSAKRVLQVFEPLEQLCLKGIR